MGSFSSCLYVDTPSKWWFIYKIIHPIPSAYLKFEENDEPKGQMFFHI